MADNHHVDDDDDVLDVPSKMEPDRDGTPSSIESTPEQEIGAEPSSEPAQPQKRKGGRKPIYATSEERKQRNRQAQAAFRERRTEYIKQLEATIKQNEETLATLQQSHRTAADECLMLRYKNSLLERILLEKGIDVQAELQMKTGSPVLGPGFMQPMGMTPLSQQSPHLQRTALQRQQARRSGSNFLPKLALGQTNADLGYPTSSPHAVAHPTPSSHASSPSQLSTRSPIAMHQSGMTPPAPIVQIPQQAQQFQSFSRTSQPQPSPAFFQTQQQPQPQLQRQAQRPAPPQTYQSSASGMSSHSTSSHHSLAQPGGGNVSAGNARADAATFYPSPFQKHFDQLDQEYDAQHSRSMLDEPPDPDDADPSPVAYAPQFMAPPIPQGDFYPQQQQLQQQGLLPPTSHPPMEVAQFGDAEHMLDADPFGLSASMSYPTNYSFQQHGGK